LSNQEKNKNEKVIEELEEAGKLKEEDESAEGGPEYENEEPRQG
jgi:hypothetical protein